MVSKTIDESSILSLPANEKLMTFKNWNLLRVIVNSKVAYVVDKQEMLVRFQPW